MEFGLSEAVDTSTPTGKMVLSATLLPLRVVSGVFSPIAGAASVFGFLRFFISVSNSASRAAIVRHEHIRDRSSLPLAQRPIERGSVN